MARFEQVQVGEIPMLIEERVVHVGHFSNGFVQLRIVDPKRVHPQNSVHERVWSDYIGLNLALLVRLDFLDQQVGHEFAEAPMKPILTVVSVSLLELVHDRAEMEAVILAIVGLENVLIQRFKALFVLQILQVEQI